MSLNICGVKSTEKFIAFFGVTRGPFLVWYESVRVVDVTPPCIEFMYIGF